MSTTGLKATASMDKRRWWDASALRDAQAGNNLPYAFMMGAVLGPLGVMLILRSWLEGFALAAAFFCIALVFPSVPGLVYWLGYGLWVVARLTLRDSSQHGASSDPTPTVQVTS